MVENFRPDVKQRLGIDYDSLKAINPRLVYASISGFGQDGPYRDRPGFDQIAQGMGGLMSITGLPGQGPVRAGIPIADLTAGLFSALGIMVALLERERSGEGQWVTTSLLQSQIFMLDFQAARWLIGGEVPQQAGNDHPTSIPTGVFRTADGHINIATTGAAIWERLLPRARRREHMIEQSRLRERQAALAEPQGASTRDIESYHRRRRRARNGSTFSMPRACRAARSIPSTRCSPIRRWSIWASRRRCAKRDGATARRRRPAGVAVAHAERHRHGGRRCPGEHTDEVLAEFGFSADEIAALRDAKAM